MPEIFIILSLTIVVPLWLVLHYHAKRQSKRQMSDSDFYQLQLLAEKAQKMSERIETLEQILDHEAPSWRNRV